MYIQSKHWKPYSNCCKFLCRSICPPERLTIMLPNSDERGCRLANPVIGKILSIRHYSGSFFLYRALHNHYLSRLMTKPTKWHVCPAKTQISLGISPVWSESLLSARRKLGSLATHWAHSKDSDQTGWMPRLIWVFAGRTVILLVLSCRDSFHLPDTG